MKKLRIYSKYLKASALLLAAALLAGGCGGQTGDIGAEDRPETEESGQEAAGEEPGAAGSVSGKAGGAGISGETAADTVVDFETLRQENPDIFAWLYIPGTDIDTPVLQSEAADDYYESHNASGETDETGALYTELANLKNMCDFNTVIHGKALQEGEGPFDDLYLFGDPDFFAEHEEFYLYLDGNLLTYEVFAAFERENTSLIRTYDFTYLSGCALFLEDLYGTRTMGMNLREGWEEVTPYHFLVTLTAHRPEEPEKQFVVVAALIGDAAGTIDRIVED